VCRVTGQVLGSGDPGARAMALPNGQVYSAAAIGLMAVNGALSSGGGADGVSALEGAIRCPETGDFFGASEATAAYFL